MAYRRTVRPLITHAHKTEGRIRVAFGEAGRKETGVPLAREALSFLKKFDREAKSAGVPK
ncbi:hypothetical protein [Treponema endosymbiont of Eucomonympha sp.]|uniref:hypothetical protein n=1 Tax=Treponema endosymbiont of Eucomonympha sp. TaxID=1580831 RepID=UPI000785BDCF|nr:hypothetical protein [Treponema endosymbiont of Eucomonympha sp.]